MTIGVDEFMMGVEEGVGRREGSKEMDGCPLTISYAKASRLQGCNWFTTVLKLGR
jgi:hypothetical protein